MADLINTTTMPGDNIDPDSIDTAATNIRGVGSSVSKQGGVVHTTWAKISGSYQAPEQETLFTAMDPVKTSAESFGTDVGTVATALQTFATEVRTIKTAVAAIRKDAAALHTRIDNGGGKVQPPGGYNPYGAGYQLPVKWDQDQATVDENNKLIHRTNDQQEALWAAERKCANAINAISCTPPIGPVTDSSGGKGYGVDDIPDGADMPWGKAVQRDESCAEKIISDGIIRHGLGGMANGIIGLAGFHFSLDHGFDWSGSTLGNSWKGLGMFAVGAATAGPLGLGLSALPGPVGNFFKDSQLAFAGTVAGLVSIDLYAKDPLHKWKENPWEAAGETGFNIATFFVSELKVGNAARAGEASRAGKVLDGAAKLTDPVYLAQRAARISADALKTMKGPTLDVLNKLFKHADLDEAVKLGTKVDVDIPTLPKDGPGTNHTNVGGGHHSDAPPARDYTGSGDHPGAGQHPGDGGHPTNAHPVTPGHDTPGTGHPTGSGDGTPGTHPGDTTPGTHPGGTHPGGTHPGDGHPGADAGKPADHTPTNDPNLAKTDHQVKAQVDQIRADIKGDLQHQADTAWQHAKAQHPNATPQQLGSYAHAELDHWIKGHAGDLVDPKSGYRIRSEASFDASGPVEAGTKGSIRPDIVIERRTSSGYEVVDVMDLKTGKAGISGTWERKVQQWLRPLYPSETLRPNKTVVPPVPAPVPAR